MIKLISVVLLFALSNSFYFGINKKPLCMLFRPANEYYHFSYQINAVEPANV